MSNLHGQGRSAFDAELLALFPVKNVSGPSGGRRRKGRKHALHGKGRHKRAPLFTLATRDVFGHKGQARGQG